MNVKPETHSRRLKPTGVAEPSETRGSTGIGPGLAPQESEGRVFERVWNRTDLFLQFKPGPLAGYPHPLVTLDEDHDHAYMLYIRHETVHGYVVSVIVHLEEYT